MAISAPYEDDGVGAVYIYMGRDNGVQQTFSQRLSPLSFPNVLTGVRGFGMGLSRGNDLDNNGHNGKFLQRHITFVIVTTKCMIYLLIVSLKTRTVVKNLI